LMQRQGLNVGQMLWRRVMTSDLMATGQYFAQEYPEDLLSCWLTAGVGFFHDDQFDHLSYYRDRCSLPTRKVSELDYKDPITGLRSGVQLLGPNLQVWEEPKPGHKYVMFADISAGITVDGDYSAAPVLDVTNGLQHVATLRVRTLPSRVGQMVAAVGAWYNWAYVGVESNTYGQSALERLQEMHYPNLYYDFINNPEHPRLGYATTNPSRELMLNRFRTAVFNHAVTINDQTAVLEMGGFTFRKVEGRSGGITFKAMAEKGNDDLVMAFAGAVTIAPYAPNHVKSGSINAMFGAIAAPALRPGDTQLNIGGREVTVDQNGIVRNTGPEPTPWFWV